MNFRGYDQQYKLFWLSYAVISQNDMLDCKSSAVLFNNSKRWSYSNSLQVNVKSLKSFEEWNFLGYKILSIALYLKDIELGLKSPMERFFPIN